jgi:hypothetical protein
MILARNATDVHALRIRGEWRDATVHSERIGILSLHATRNVSMFQSVSTGRRGCRYYQQQFSSPMLPCTPHPHPRGHLVACGLYYFGTDLISFVFLLLSIFFFTVCHSHFWYCSRHCIPTTQTEASRHTHTHLPSLRFLQCSYTLYQFRKVQNLHPFRHTSRMFSALVTIPVVPMSVPNPTILTNCRIRYTLCSRFPQPCPLGQSPSSIQFIAEALKWQFAIKATLTGVNLGGGVNAPPIFLYLRIVFFGYSVSEGQLKKWVTWGKGVHVH